MNLTNDKPYKIFIHYLIAALGGALIVSVYSLVDSAMIGQYEGSIGVASIACVSPMWNLILSSGLFIGMGGATIMATLFGKNDVEEGKRVYTISFIIALLICAFISFIMIFFEDQLLILFGADELLLPLAKQYLKYLKYSYPLFTFSQFLMPFIRNDNAPMTATISTLIAGVSNIVLDFVFVFVLDLGIMGAGIATCIGQYLATIYLFIHYFNKNNRLEFVKFNKTIKNSYKIMKVGFPVFILDIAIGILAIVMNNNIMKYFDANALSIYGVILNCNALIFATSYAIGNCAQPLISNNLGAKNYNRIIDFTKLSIYAIIFFTVIWFIFLMCSPTFLIKIFMIPNDEVLKIGPFIMRSYFTSYLFTMFNVFITYYLQAILKEKQSFIITLLRGLILSTLFIYLLPLINKNLLWFAMLFDEIIIAIISLFLLIKYTKQIKNETLLIN